jgi:N-acetyl-anhydromuramyl-L-alanine amidase AmpD
MIVLHQEKINKKGELLMRDIKYIFVHCTASYQSNTTEASLRAEFKAKGWNAPGYHWVIKTDGNIIKMLDEQYVANGVKGYNSYGVHIAWIGGIDKTHPKGIDNRTPAQKVALYDLVAKVKMRYPKAKILGHRDISPDLNHNGIVDPWERIKECPCFDAMVEYKELNDIK